MYRNFKLIDYVVYGRGSFDQLDGIIESKRGDNGHAVFLVDNYFEQNNFNNRLPLKKNDLLIWADVFNEPTTQYVDELTEKVRLFNSINPSAIIGIGGGTTMDLAKAVSLMLTNEGSSADYQGWDLIKNQAIYHVGIPTLSGTGAEVSRTTVLSGPVKKLGINSDQTVFNQVILDPDLIADAPTLQHFYTGMDCYIHNVEALTGNFMNAFARAYAEKSLEMCREVFLSDIPKKEKDEKLMMASMFGGMSIAYSQVGVCHALSYGISYVLKLRHGMSNCIVFNQLDDYYLGYVDEFREMMKLNKITLEQNLTENCSDKDFEIMADISEKLVPLWEHALGKNWQTIMPREKMIELFKRM